MKDIDFDELDKAVNSLMTPRSVSAPVSKPEQNPGTTDSGLQVKQASAENLSSPSGASTVNKPESPALNTMQRTTGRFMDVVHPSSDMRSTSPLRAPSRSSGITPPSRSKPFESSSSKPVETPVLTEDKYEASPSPQAEIAPDTSFPDPLDMTAVVKDEVEAPSGDGDATLTPRADYTEGASAKDEQIQQSIPNSLEGSSETLESLFLPNVKVEKRPLGIANGTDEPIGDESGGVSKVEEVEDAEKSDTLVTPDPTLAELGEDVLAIESDASKTADEQDKTEQELAKGTLDTDAPDSTSASSSAISSIPRQYNVKPSTDDKHHEALYDTAAQGGTPLAHPAKKKSGWMVVLWIVLLVVVGVGGALALYFLKVF